MVQNWMFLTCLRHVGTFNFPYKLATAADRWNWLKSSQRVHCQAHSWSIDGQLACKLLPIGNFIVENDLNWQHNALTVFTWRLLQTVQFLDLFPRTSCPNQFGLTWSQPAVTKSQTALGTYNQKTILLCSTRKSTRPLRYDCRMPMVRI